MTRDEAQKAVEKHGSQRKAAAALGVCAKRLSKVLTGGKGNAKPTPEMAAPATAQGVRVRSAKEFREAHDKSVIIPARIRDALKRMTPKGWLYEVEFSRFAGVSLLNLGAYRQQFDALVVTVDGKRLWAGSVALANEFKEAAI